MHKSRIERIAIQGKRASFSYLAAMQVCQSGQFLYRDTFDEVFEDLRLGRADLVIVPIENSTYGSVYENYDKLTGYDCQILAEIYIHVSLCLIGLPGSSLKDIKQVYSHQVALDQIRQFRKRHPNLEFLPHRDTAGAAEMIKRRNRPELAACASRLAAEANNLEILDESIEDNHHNFTRFFAIARDRFEMPATELNKTTVQFELGQESGSLYKSLRSFADRDLTLSRIESRPIIHTAWTYRFYLDIVADGEDPKLQHALAEMRSYVKDNRVDILGSYPSLNPQAESNT